MQHQPVPLIEHVRAHPLTWLVLSLSCVPFATLTLHNLAAVSAWFMPTNLAELWQTQRPWSLWSPVFVHYTPLHLLTNLYLWWLLAARIEAVSRTQLLWLFLLLAPVTNLAQWWATGPKFGGLSGLVYALLGYLWARQRWGSQRQYHVEAGLTLVMLALIPLSMTGAFGKFSDYAHLSGLVGGLLVGALMATRKQDRD